jgi:hypothetical protein
MTAHVWISSVELLGLVLMLAGVLIFNTVWLVLCVYGKKKETEDG